MPTKKSKPKGAKPPETKICMHCKQVRPVSDYYANRDWVTQLGKDAWCKTCANKCRTKDSLREYFWENNREWNERLWETGIKKAELAANKNEIYQKTTEDRRKLILEQLACQNVLKSMLVNYKFVDNTGDINTQSYQEAKENGLILEEKDPNVKRYSEEFNGHFKEDELEYLNRYYEGLTKDFNLNDTNLQDIGRKVAKASLQADRVQDRYMAGQATMADVKDAIALFDLLSKSGNFAACKRKPEESSSGGSYSELTLYLETHGHPMTRKIEWERDSIDEILDQYKHIAKALELDGAE